MEDVDLIQGDLEMSGNQEDAGSNSPPCLPTALGQRKNQVRRPRQERSVPAAGQGYR